MCSVAQRRCSTALRGSLEAMPVRTRGAEIELPGLRRPDDRPGGSRPARRRSSRWTFDRRDGPLHRRWSLVTGDRCGNAAHLTRLRGALQRDGRGDPGRRVRPDASRNADDHARTTFAWCALRAQPGAARRGGPPARIEAVGPRACVIRRFGGPAHRAGRTWTRPDLTCSKRRAGSASTLNSPRAHADGGRAGDGDPARTGDRITGAEPSVSHAVVCWRRCVGAGTRCGSTPGTHADAPSAVDRWPGQRSATVLFRRRDRMRRCPDKRPADAARGTAPVSALLGGCGTLTKLSEVGRPPAMTATSSDPTTGASDLPAPHHADAGFAQIVGARGQCSLWRSGQPRLLQGPAGRTRSATSSRSSWSTSPTQADLKNNTNGRRGPARSRWRLSPTCIGLREQALPHTLLSKAVNASQLVSVELQPTTTA